MPTSDIERMMAAASRYQQHKARAGETASANDPERMKNRLKLKGYTDQEAAQLVSVARMGDAVSNAAVERIINTSDLTPIAFFHKGYAISRAVGRIVIGDSAGRPAGYGTGFRISPRLIMTNNHVLGDKETARQSIMQFDYIIGLDGKDVMELEVRLDPDAFFQTDERLDFTIVALEARSAQDARLDERIWLPLLREPGKALDREPLNIVQHPLGGRQMIAFRHNETIGIFDDFFHYETDTEPGSSGSPVLNDGWQLAALHHSGVPDTDPVTKVPLKRDKTPFRTGDDPTEIEWIANEGVRISKIVAHVDAAGLSTAERALYDQCFTDPDFRVGVERLVPAPHNLDGGRTSEPATNPTVDGNGRVTWHFALSFGPTGSLSPNPHTAPKIPPTSPAPLSRPSGSTKLSTPPDDNSGPFGAMARRLIENARPQKPYFDAEKNRQDKDHYYANIDLSAASIPFSTMREKLTRSHTPLSDYNTARIRHLYPWVDIHEDGDLQSIYSGAVMSAEEIVARELASINRADPKLAELLVEGHFEEAARRESTVGAKLEALEATTMFNCEHVVPQSWFAKAEPQRSDLHHLFTCESDCNSYRGNIPYHDFADYNPDPQAEEAVRKLCGKRDKAEDAVQGFEPEHGKGAVARATLYYLMRYPGDIGDGDRELPKNRLETLLAWHQKFPPSLWELHRNQAIAEIQGNRNPLIDFPEIARKINFIKGFAR